MELRHVLTKIYFSVWRRAACMVRACIPDAMDEEDMAEQAECADEATRSRRGHPGKLEASA